MRTLRLSFLGAAVAVGVIPAVARALEAAARERCWDCHAALQQRPVVHRALDGDDCTACHVESKGQTGQCKSRTASKWKLVKQDPDLCYECHDRKDQQKFVHTALRQGGCLSCHDPHSSNYPRLIQDAREKICFNCHDAAALLAKPVKHAPVAEGRCLECHDPHGSDRPKGLRSATANDFCLKCHDVKAPFGSGTPGPGYRIDLSKKVVHPALEVSGCTGCHEPGHSGENARLLKKKPADLCLGCHELKSERFPHGAVVLGDCVVCHDPHSSDRAKLLAKPTIQETCFSCHQDDVTGRKVIHPVLTQGCDQCHDPHGAPNRFVLKAGSGKDVCYACHDTVDAGKVKHGAIERYGCTVCHDPHGTANEKLLVKSVNDLCASCHPAEQDGRHVTNISGIPHVVGGDLRDPRRPDKPFTCASCHDPHGSDNPRMFYFGSDPMEACEGCHGDKSGKNPELKDIISKARPPPTPAPASNRQGDSVENVTTSAGKKGENGVGR